MINNHHLSIISRIPCMLKAAIINNKCTITIWHCHSFPNISTSLCRNRKIMKKLLFSNLIRLIMTYACVAVQLSAMKGLYLGMLWQSKGKPFRRRNWNAKYFQSSQNRQCWRDFLILNMSSTRCTFNTILCNIKSKCVLWHQKLLHQFVSNMFWLSFWGWASLPFLIFHIGKYAKRDLNSNVVHINLQHRYPPSFRALQFPRSLKISARHFQTTFHLPGPSSSEPICNRGKLWHFKSDNSLAMATLLFLAESKYSYFEYALMILCIIEPKCSF